MAFSVISTMEGSRVLFRKTSNLMSFGSNRPGATKNKGKEYFTVIKKDKKNCTVVMTS